MIISLKPPYAPSSVPSFSSIGALPSPEKKNEVLVQRLMIHRSLAQSWALNYSNSIWGKHRDTALQIILNFSTIEQNFTLNSLYALLPVLDCKPLKDRNNIQQTRDCLPQISSMIAEVQILFVDWEKKWMDLGFWSNVWSGIQLKITTKTEENTC